jgi:hypothetical protein
MSASRFHAADILHRAYLARAQANPQTGVFAGDNKQTAGTGLRDEKERYERFSIGAICCVASNRNAAMRQHRISVTDTLADRTMLFTPPKLARPCIRSIGRFISRGRSQRDTLAHNARVTRD